MIFAVHTVLFRRLMRLTLAAYLIANTIGSGIHFHFDALVDSFQHDESAITLHLHADSQQARSHGWDLGFHSSTQHYHPVPHFVVLATAPRHYSHPPSIEHPSEIAVVTAAHDLDFPLAARDMLATSRRIPRARDSVLILPTRAPPLV
ncbi:MAG: hypothetical protein WC824_05060 [Bacteroidota bacterium]